MQRVEVLLGPQATLWGKNGIGGAIDFITAHPGTTLAAAGSAGYGNLGNRFVNGMVNGPLRRRWRRALRSCTPLGKTSSTSVIR
jgi:iron complex outermembrane recepter protein